MGKTVKAAKGEEWPGIYHDIPLLCRAKGSTHLQHHTCQKPEQATNAVLALVVGRDTNINISHGRVCITEGNSGDVSKSSFLNGLQGTIQMLQLANVKRCSQI